MPQKSGFFDTTADDPREYPAREFAEYFARFVGNGVFSGGTKLKVTATGNDANVKIDLGYAWINGYMYSVFDTPLTLPIAPATTQDRIDRVILRLDTSTPVRAVQAMVIQGLPNASPTPPGIVRSGDIYDLSLAQVRIKANSSIVLAENITDERLNNAVCGLVTGLVQQADTTTIFNQFQAWLNTKTAEYQQQWQDFLKGIQDEGFATTQYVNQTSQAKADAAETNAKGYVDAKPWQKVKVTDDAGLAINIGSQNLNTARQSGWYMGSGMANAPGTGWYFIEIIRHNDLWEVQNAYDFNGSGSFQQRKKQNGVWTAWSQDLFTSVANGKQAIATAISGKGIAASGSDEFAVLANKISQIQTSSYQRTYYDWSSGTLPVQRGVMKYTTLADLGVVKGVLSVMSYTTGTHPDSTYSAMARTWVTTGAYTNDTVTAGFSLTNSLGQVQSLSTLTDNEPYTYKRAELYLLSLHVDIPNRKYTIVTYNYQSERYNLSTNLFTPEFNLTVPLSLKTVSYTNSSAAKDAEGDGRIKGFVTIT